MIRIKRIIAIFFATALLSGCSDEYLNVEPSDYVSDKQLEDMASLSPEALIKVMQPKVTGLYSWLTQYNSLGLPSANVRHNDFGYTSILLRSELWGQDMIMTGNAYGWLDGDYVYSNWTYTGNDCLIPWNYFYKLIKSANDIIGAIPETATDTRLKHLRGQALAMRGFAYHNLVQLYQFTYKGHENAAGVPIVVPGMTPEQLANNPRASVAKVYELIEKDYMTAYDLLEGFSTAQKTDVERPIVAGLLARVYLCKEEWVNAAKYAGIARQGLSPMTAAEYNNDVTGFNEISNPAWMWGADNTIETDIVKSGIINFISHIGSLSYGYAYAGKMYKAISKEVYDRMSNTDERKKAFVGPQGLQMNPKWKLPAYANIKFKPYKGDILGDDNATDYVFMRVEEMYLIEAEAKAMNNDVLGAKTVLEEMVKTRDPQYAANATTSAGMREEIWWQRRIELWGEGFAWFDLKRLKKGTNRSYEGSNHRTDARYSLPAEHGLFLLRIAESELRSNKGIPEEANNPIAVRP